MQTETKQEMLVNGVNVTKLFETIDAIKQQPMIAKFRFNARNEWLGCGHNRSTINEYYGAMEEMGRREPFTMDADEPPILLGEDSGANPVEYLLHALAACVTTSMVYHAAARGITIEEVESTIEGAIDLHGFLGLDPNIRRGFQEITMKFKIKADADDEKLEEIVNLGSAFSPVFDSVTNGVPVKVMCERK